MLGLRIYVGDSISFRLYFQIQKDKLSEYNILLYSDNMDRQLSHKKRIHLNFTLGSGKQQEMICQSYTMMFRCILKFLRVH